MDRSPRPATPRRASLSSIKHAGGPWELGPAETQQTLLENGLRDRIVVQTDGQLKTGRGKHVVIIGGGDTGADCLGTAHRQGAASVTQLEIMPTPPEHRTDHMPWPTYPMVYRVSSAHEEGGDRLFSVNTTEFVADADGTLRALRLVEVTRDEDFMTTVDGVFAAGDMGRGQSLVVWAIAEGRAAAAGVDAYLTGRDVLPRPIAPTDRLIT